MVKTPGIGLWVDVFLVKEIQQQDSLIFFVNIFKPSTWRTPHCYLAFSGTKRSLWFCALMWTTSSWEVNEKQWNSLCLN